MQELKQKPPDFLKHKSELAYYHSIIDLLTDNDIPILAQDSYALGTFATNLYLLEICSQEIIDNGVMLNVNGDRGMITKVNPAISLQKDVQTALRFYYVKFQMTPDSRGKGLTITPGSLKGKDTDGFEGV